MDVQLKPPLMQSNSHNESVKDCKILRLFRFVFSVCTNLSANIFNDFVHKTKYIFVCSFHCNCNAVVIMSLSNSLNIHIEKKKNIHHLICCCCCYVYGQYRFIFGLMTNNSTNDYVLRRTEKKNNEKLFQPFYFYLFVSFRLYVY